MSRRTRKNAPIYSADAALKYPTRGRLANLTIPSYNVAYPTVNAAPPTLTWGTSSVVTSPVQVPCQDPRIAYPSSLLSFGSNYVVGMAGNSSGNLTVSFEYTGKKMSIVLRSSVNSGQMYRLTVDGQPLNLRAQAIGVAVTAGQIAYLTLDFGATVGPHRIELDLYLMGLTKLEVGPQDSVSALVRNKRKIGVITDSFGGGANQLNDGVTSLETYPWHLSQMFGCEFFNGGQGGSGYANNGKGNVSSNEVFGHSSRVDQMIAAGVDELWFWGSVNDANSSYTPTQAGNGAAAAYAYVAAQAPTLPVYVFGVQPSTSPDATMWGYHFGTQTALKAAAAAAPNVRGFVDLAGHYGTTIAQWAFNTVYNVGDRFYFSGAIWKVYVAHTSAGSGTPNQGYAGPIGAFYGHGYSSAQQNDGNRDVALSTDQVHPTFVGHRILAVATAREYVAIRAAE